MKFFIDPTFEVADRSRLGRLDVLLHLMLLVATGCMPLAKLNSGWFDG